MHFMLSEMKEIPIANQTMKETPLHAACEANHYEIVVKLIIRFPELLLVQDCLSHRRWHPIHTACAFGTSVKILEALLVGILCLMTKEYEMVSGTLVHMWFFDALDRTPLYLATKCGNLSHVYLMMTSFLFDPLMQSAPTLYTIPITKPWPSPIHCAITYGREELLVSLLDALPLKVYAYPSVYALRHMLQCKDTDNKQTNFPQLETTICESSDGELHLIDTSSTIKDYEALKSYKVLSNLKLSPLAMAAAMGNANFSEKLLNKGAKDDDGLALRLALFLQYHDIAGMILSRSCDASQICLGNMKKLSTFLLPNNILNSFTEIHLEDNCLNSIPLVLFQLPKLTFLNVSKNQLVKLPVSNSSFQSGWHCNNMKNICISSNKLETLPAVIWNLQELRELHADNNCISEIESPAGPCARLKKIDVSCNELSNVPQHIFLAEMVNISYNRLESLPECMWKSKVLIASNNQIKEIHFPKSPCTHEIFRGALTSFTAKGERTFVSEYKGCNMNTLSSLDLSSNNLTNFPKYLACFAYHLHDLKISNNPICILYIHLLPPCITFLSADQCSLKNIDICCDDKESLCPHKTHTSLKDLTSLSLKENELNQFQFSFKSDTDPKTDILIYPELVYLYLSNNLLCGQLDSNIRNQRCLQILHLSGNHNLKSLPLELSHLSDTLSVLQLDDIPKLTNSQLRKYQSNQSPANLMKLLSYMKSAMKRYVASYLYDSTYIIYII